MASRRIIPTRKRGNRYGRAIAFHVEINAGLQHARAFNLSQEEMRRTVLGPWLSGRAVKLGDRKWDPQESELRVLEGPEMSNPDLAFGQGWANAERASEEVTPRVLAAAREELGAGSGPTALVIETGSAVQTVAEIASAHAAYPVDLQSLREQIDGRDPEVAAVVVVIQRPGPA